MFERYPDYEYTLASLQLGFAMLGMGATLTAADFAKILRAPLALAVGLGTQLISVPLVAAAIAWLLGLEPGLSLGLVLVAAVPGGSMSNVAVYLGRGNTTLSISLTTVSTIGCLVTAPLILRLFSSDYLPDSFQMPFARVAFEIGVCLLCPLALGMLVGWLLPNHKGRFTRTFIAASLFVIAVMVIGGAASGRVDAGAYGAVAVAALLLTALAFQQVAALTSRLFRLPASDAVTVGVEATIRNTNLALLLKASLFPVVAGVPDPIADQVFFVALLYGGVAVFVAVPALLLHSRRNASRGGARA